MKTNIPVASVSIRSPKQLFLNPSTLLYFTFLFMCLFWSESLSGQTPAPPIDSYVNFENGEGIIFVAIADSAIISEIEVQIGSKGVGDNVFSHSYVYDQTSGLPSGLTYARSGLQVYLGIGTISPPSAFNVMVRLKDTSGNWSSWLEYVSN